ncbi:hypothetical protein J5N97_019967 [Dioscorea zingiberensis]|uniref:C2H2-type domain-containing protein n=1 Tax=Dioscorea zingiberensis TaxID=325984 RepID=A0A9D5CG10_9LILI|nr:hypothetical protein J5N97_019967 [Dioscorea zingiberensis]
MAETTKKKKVHSEAENPSPRMALKSFFSCKHHQEAMGNKKCRRMGCSRSIFSLKDNNNNNSTRGSLVESPKKRVSLGSGSTSSRSLKAPLSEINGVVPSLRSNISPCPDCGEIFMKPESLELHQSVRHAVTELGPEDTSRNIVEIIFQSSWLKRQGPLCKIERILKVHNTQRTITRFEDYRDSIKSKASKLAKKHPRCIADGNELLRFHCTTIKCSLGMNGSTNLCDFIPHCSVCSIIRDGFKTDSLGKIKTMATSGRAHDSSASADDAKRAMLVCRVIAGRVKKNQDATEECDSVAGMAGIYSNLDELFVFNTKAILPCFVVIYGSGF